MEIAKADRRTPEPLGIAEDTLELRQAGADHRQALLDRGLVGCAARHRDHHALPHQLADDAGVGIGVDDADDLIHLGQLLDIAGLQFRSAETAIDIAGDRRGFVEL